MGFQVLEIHRLDPSGGIVRKIRCLSGHITVFRANDPTLMEAYRRALVGLPTDSERFSLLLDGVPGQPQDFYTIGFGERFSSVDQMTAGEYLASLGADEAAAEALVGAFGLAELKSVSVSALSEPEARILRLLGATISSEKIILLNDPFQGLNPEMSQRAARALVDFAWNRKAIVLVTKLTDRPVDWIENEIVQRVQLERPRQRTIGYGGEDDQTAALVKAIRADAQAEMSAKPDGEVETFTPLMPRSEAIQFSPDPAPIKKERRLLYGGAIVAILGMTLIGVLFERSANAPTTSADEASVVQQVTAGAAAEGTVAVAPSEPPSNKVLERYPVEVRDAVAQAFNDPEAALRAETGFRAEAPKREIVQSGQIVVPPPPPPAYTNPITAGGEDSSTLNLEDEEAMNRRREEIRRRFLEAIQRQQGG